jgi:hypothetical protein
MGVAPDGKSVLVEYYGSLPQPPVAPVELQLGIEEWSSQSWWARVLPFGAQGSLPLVFRPIKGGSFLLQPVKSSAAKN